MPPVLARSLARSVGWLVPPSPFDYRYQPSYDYIRYRAEPGGEVGVGSGEFVGGCRVGDWVAGMGDAGGGAEGRGGEGEGEGRGGPGCSSGKRRRRSALRPGHESGFLRAREEDDGTDGGRGEGEGNRNLGNRVFQLDGTARSRSITGAHCVEREAGYTRTSVSCGSDGSATARSRSRWVNGGCLCGLAEWCG